jgi:hypothetical protein
MKGIMIQLKTVQGLFHVEATESILLMQAFENSTHLSAQVPGFIVGVGFSSHFIQMPNHFLVHQPAVL